jgi:hypothetical protein
VAVRNLLARADPFRNIIFFFISFLFIQHDQKKTGGDRSQRGQRKKNRRRGKAERYKKDHNTVKKET